jgi:hypothetical protein|tara:strand:+ start:233 stop:1546 length:1314 start_codon:yes stop_codon:yes gene_type:complete
MENYKSRYLELIIFFLFFCNLFFGHGFQILTFFNLPVNYILLIVLVLFSFNQKTFNILKIKKIHSIIFLFLALNFFRLIFNTQEFGLMALRDATYSIDMLFLISSLYIFSINDIFDKFKNLIKICFFTVFLFIIFWIFRDFVEKFSPTITSITGQTTRLFFNWSTIALYLVWFSFYKIIFHDDKIKISSLIILIFFILFSLIVFQRRFIYLCLIALFLISFFLKKKETIQILVFFLLGIMIIPILNYLGISLEGKIGKVSNIFFFIDHLASSIPGYVGDESEFLVSSGTAQTRIEFIKYALQKQFSSLFLFLFGSGFGQPLVDFKATGGFVVREPHNMYLTIFARSGFIGFVLFIIINIKLIYLWFETYHYIKDEKKSSHYQLLIFSGIYFIFIYVTGLTDSSLSNNYLSIIFNILWGVIISINHLYTKKDENFTNS